MAKSSYPKAGEPPPVGSSQLFISHIFNHPPYLEAISSIHNLRTCHPVLTRNPLSMDPSANISIKSRREMGETHITHREEEKCTWNSNGKPQEKRQFYMILS
jgi:hypothetical protein